MVRKEPTISGLAPSRATVKARPTAKAASTTRTEQATVRSKNQTTAKPNSAQDRVRPSNSSARSPSYGENTVAEGSAVGVTFALFLSVLAFAGASYVYWLGGQDRAQLVNTETRLMTLEKRLELTDDESTQSLTSLQVKLKTANSEIRKLWAVAYDTNRKNIESQKKQLKSQETQLSQTKKSLKKLSVDLKSLNSSLSALRKSLPDEKALRTQMQANSDNVSAHSRLLSEKISSLKKHLSEQLRDNEEAIEAINAYRLSHNKSYLKLKDSLNSMQK